MNPSKSCLEETRAAEKMRKKGQMGIIMRKSINTCKNQQEPKVKAELERNNSDFKEMTHFYKRVVTYSPEKHLSAKVLE